MGHRHCGAKTRGQCPALRFPAIWCSQEGGAPARLLWPGSRVWGPSLGHRLGTDSNSAPGPCFQSSVSKGESWSQSFGPVVGEGKAGQTSGTSSCPSRRGPSNEQKPGRGAERGSGVAVQRAGRHESGALAAARTAWTAARPSAATAASPADAPPPPSAW